MTRAALWVLAGLASVSLGLGGVAALSSSDAEAAGDDWRPTCARSLGEAYAALDVRTEATQDPGRVVLLGIDRSPSNAEQANAQLQTAAAFASALPMSDSVSVMFVSDRSDRSSTPDLPVEPATSLRTATADPLPCAPECESRSLFEHACLQNIEAALETRTQTVQAEIDLAAQGQHAARRARIMTWAASAHAYWPKPGTSIMGFWRKVADLPTVRNDPERVTVVLLSDLEEARTRERRDVRRFERERKASRGACPESPVPAELRGVNIVLLQTVTDGVDAQRWGETWTALLTCGGATVTRYRYSPSVPLREYL